MSEDGRQDGGARRGRRPRMADVAARAGVSLVTVSRALGQPQLVSPETRQRVTAAVAELGYLPDLVAGSLASSQTRIVGAVVPTLANSFFAASVQGLSEVLDAAGYQLLLGNSGYDTRREQSLAAAFLGRRADGLVLTGSRHEAALRGVIAGAGVPVVETWELPAEPLDMVAGFSNDAAAEAMTAGLLDWGYRRIAFVGLPDGGESRSDQRRKGWRRAHADRGLEAGPHIAVEDANSPVGGEAALERALALAPAVDALFCANDTLALGAIVACQKAGVAVPGRIAVAGFGDFDLAPHLVPGLTTVRVPGGEMGETAGRMLLDRLAGRRVEPRVVDLGFEIVRRASA
ncbi:transcriptional regulator, LacI family [Tistlia consotensis]|uniref:Transcriptional regulator, LacI family n=1 Tax=Tistlia consotensis USBA 355 TaxID=560819 RepID=A0A1Y6B8B0_9PROT|nr:LacI family DNA-binding transcriptional regulator [Tistlia consotensis]SME98155.1 transcriptional regulator, LacI family [Tistlia consotensis USBA 355]SNR57551.1 transcriptional regulator, LacI family [Tistlia consotensis]